MELGTSAVFTTNEGVYLGNESFLEYPNGLDDSVPGNSISAVLIAGAICCLLLAALMCGFISISLCYLKQHRRSVSANITYQHISTAPGVT